MEKYWEIATIITDMTELFIQAGIIGSFYRKYLASKKSVRLVSLFYILVIVCLYFCSYETQGVVKFTIGAAVIFLVSWFFDKRNLPQKVFLAVTIYLLRWIAAGLSMILWDRFMDFFLNPASAGTPWQDLFYYLISKVVTEGAECILFLLGVLLVNRAYLYKRDRMTGRELILLLAPCVTIVFGYWLSLFFNNIYEQKTKNLVWGDYPEYRIFLSAFQLAAFLSVLTVIHMYQRIKRTRRRQTEEQIISVQMQELEKRIHTVEKFYRDIRGMKHDMNHHVMIMENLYKKGAYGEAYTYLSEWKKSITEAGQEMHTGNPVTDIILSEKGKEMQEKGIEFKAEFQYPDSEGPEILDVSIILMNALENAATAAEKSEKPFVSVFSWMNRNAYLIEVRNSFCGTLHHNPETGFPDTEKEDAEKHGFGLENMRRIAEKYKGTIRLEQEEHEVVLSVMLMTK